MRKSTAILAITSIIVLAILVSILVVVIIEKDNTDTEKENYGEIHGNYGYESVESESNKRISEQIENICETSEYNPYGKPFIMFAEVLRYPEYDIEYSEYDKFTSSEDYVWRCTKNSIDEEYIGECIGIMTSMNNKKEYEIYRIKDISSEYAVAFKETEPDCYMGLVNTEKYAPENLQDFIEDTNLKNSDVEINMIFMGQFNEGNETKYGIMTFIDKDEYLWNEFFDSNKYLGEDFFSDHCIEDFKIYIYQKTLKSIYAITINDKGNIDICSNYRQPYEFESTTEDAIKFIEYLSENYEGYKEESPVQAPKLGDKNEFIND